MTTLPLGRSEPGYFCLITVWRNIMLLDLPWYRILAGLPVTVSLLRF